MDPRRIPRKEIGRILLIRLRHIGDVLLTVPAIRAFRRAFPGAFLAALVNAGTEEMLEGNPLLDEVLVFDPRWKKLPLPARVKEEARFLRQVRRQRFDLAVHFTEGDRGAFIALASGARYKVGLMVRDGSLWWKRRVFDFLVPIPDGRAHTVEQILEFPRYLGLETADKRVEIFFSAADRLAVDEMLGAEGLAPAAPLAQVHPTSRWLFKCWRDEGMARVIDQLEESGKVRVVLTAGPERKELEKVERILALCRTRPASLAGKTTLKELAALSARCRFFLGVDSAPMHMAAAAGIPVIALFGPSGEFNWGPWGPGHVVIKKDLPCRPCGQDGCQGTKRSRCLEEITETEVLEKVFQILEDGPPALDPISS